MQQASTLTLAWASRTEGRGRSPRRFLELVVDGTPLAEMVFGKESARSDWIGPLSGQFAYWPKATFLVRSSRRAVVPAAWVSLPRPQHARPRRDTACLTAGNGSSRAPRNPPAT